VEMKRNSVFELLAVCALLAASACDQYDGAGSATIGGGPSGLLGDEAEEDAFAETMRDDSESDPPSIEVAWTDEADISAQSRLSFTVSNTTTDRDIAFSVSVVSQGFLGTGERHLADLTLGPGESEAISFRASDLPVRSEAVMSLMAVGIRLAHEVLADPPRDARLTATRYYRHAPGLDAARAYGAEALQAELNGVLFESAGAVESMTEAALESEVLGEKAVAGGDSEAVSLAASDLVVWGSLGDALGVITRVSIGTADTSGEDAMVTPEDPSAEEEMEVDDE